MILRIGNNCQMIDDFENVAALDWWMVLISHHRSDGTICYSSATFNALRRN